MLERADMDLFVQRSYAERGELEEVARGLFSCDESLAGDCAEILRAVAERASSLVRPYRGMLESLLDHESARVQSEAVRTVALLDATSLSRPRPPRAPVRT